MWIWIGAQGLVTGFIMAAPLGPVAFFCIQKAFLRQTHKAVLAAIGACIADIVLAFGAAHGMRLFSGLFEEYDVMLRLVGSLVVLIIGVVLLLSKPCQHPKSLTTLSGMAIFSGALFMTLLNPLTFMAFAAAFSALHLETLEIVSSLGTLVIGVGVGAGIWWSLLIALSTFGRKKISLEQTSIIHRGTGAIFCMLGVGALISTLF